MASELNLHRVELALPAFGATLLALASVVGVDAVRFHGDVLSAEAGWPASAMLLVVLAAGGSIGVARAAGTLVSQLTRQKRFLGALRILGTRRLAGHDVVVVDDGRAFGLCAGFWRPRIFVSTAAIAVLSERQLRAVVAHEARHAERRDPLRVLVARMAGSAVPFSPSGGRLAQRQAALAELAADAAAVRTVGGPEPLAGALLALGGSTPAPTVVAIAPERVDQLLGRPLPTHVPRLLLVLVGGVLLAVVSGALWLATMPGHPRFGLPALAAPLCFTGAALILVCPAWVASRRAAAALRPSRWTPA